MRGVGVDNTRSRELVDITIVIISAVPIILWSLYAAPRSAYRMHPAKLSIAAAFLALPVLAITAQTLAR